MNKIYNESKDKKMEFSITKKQKKFDLVYIIIGVAFAIGGLFLPKSGRFALLDVAANNLIVWGIFIYMFLKVRKFSGGIKKNLYIYAVCLFLAVFSLLSTKSLVMDLISGPKVITLNNVNLSKRQGAKGLVSLHYYLNGSDLEGNNHTIEISDRDYTNINRTDTLVITYYENTDRLYDIGAAR